jgi:hypothetical protein
MSLLVFPLTILVDVVGAAVVFVLAVFVLPLPAVLERAGAADASHWRLNGSVRLRGRPDRTRIAEPLAQ